MAKRIWGYLKSFHRRIKLEN